MYKSTGLPFSAPSLVNQCPFLSGGHQDCMQYSSLGLINDLYNCIIISSDFYIKVLLIIPRILLVAFAAFKHCLLHFNSFVIITISRSSCTTSRGRPSILHNPCRFPAPICNVLHLLILNNINQSFDQLHKLTKSDHNMSIS